MRKPVAHFVRSLAFLLLGSPVLAYMTDLGPHLPPNYNSFIPPGRGATYADPVFGTVVRRASAALQTPDSANGGYLTWIMNEYSSMSPFNQDRSLLILQHGSYFALYDGQGSYIRDLPFEIYASTEPRWARANKNILYYINGNTLKRYDASTGATAVQHVFGEYSQISGKGESDISFDGDHMVLVGNGRYVFVYTISTDSKGPVYDAGGVSFDSVYITPNNNVTITWYQAGSGRGNGIELFDSSMVFQRQLTRAGGHMDVTRDTNGDEVLVWANAADPAPVCSNGVVKVRLSSGEQTCLVSLDWSLAIHVSAPDAGSAIVGTYAPSNPDPGGGWKSFTNEVFQVTLDGTQVRRFLHHRSRPYNSYTYTPRASISRDGRKLVYSSNYGLQATQGAPTEYSDAYVIDVPPLNRAGRNIVAGRGHGPSNGNDVRVFTSDGSATGVAFTPYASGAWGTNVASANVDGSATPQVLTGPGPGPMFGPQVRAFDRNGVALGKVNYYAYGTLRYGVNVDAGNVDGASVDEMLTASGPSSMFGPHVRGFRLGGSGVTPLAKLSFFAYQTPRYGARAVGGDVDGDQVAEIVTAPGPGPSFSAVIRGFDYNGLVVSPIAKINFNPFPGAGYGAGVVAGDVDEDGVAEMAVAPGPGNGLASRFLGFSYDGAGIAALPGFDVTAFPSSYGGRPALGDVGGPDAGAELLAAAGPDPAADSTIAAFAYSGSALSAELGFVPFPGAAHGAAPGTADLGW